MHRRALLASTASLSLTVLSGCLADSRRTVSGHIRQDHGYAKLHPTDERVVDVPFPDDGNLRGWVFPDPPDDQRAVFTEQAMQGEFSNDLLWAEGDSFVLLTQVRMSRADAAFYNVGRPSRWTGWNSAEIPIRCSQTQFHGDDGVDELVCTSLSKFDVEGGGAPRQVTLQVRDRETGESLGSYSIGAWTSRRTPASE